MVMKFFGEKRKIEKTRYFSVKLREYLEMN